MKLIDLLLELKIPAWLILIITAIGFSAIVYYKFLLNIKLKKLEHDFNEEEIKRTKLLELVQERFRERIGALSELNKPLMDFHHAILHISQGDIRQGDKNYTKDIDRCYKEIREISRRHELSLGNEFYESIIRYTNIGKQILYSDNFNLDEYAQEEENIQNLKNYLKSTLPIIS